MKIYIGLPSMEARYAMFKMCIMELVCAPSLCSVRVTIRISA